MSMKVTTQSPQMHEKYQKKPKKKLTCLQKIEKVLCKIFYFFFPCIKNADKQKDTKMTYAIQDTFGGYDTPNYSPSVKEDNYKEFKDCLNLMMDLDASEKNVIYQRIKTVIRPIKANNQEETSFFNAVLSMRTHAKRILLIDSKNENGKEIYTFGMGTQNTLEYLNNCYWLKLTEKENLNIFKVEKIKTSPYAVKV